eukprot:scaffold48193_cov52-Attheya_sp.AAC.1
MTALQYGTQGCPLSIFFSCLILHELLSNLDNELRARAKIRRKNKDLGDDGRGSVSDILTYMDDGQVVIPYVDLRFFLDRITELGPTFGLSLELNKTTILTSTSGISPMPFLPPQSQQDLQYCLDKYTNPCAETLDGVDILGYPIGNKKFMTNSLLKTDDKLLSDTTNLFNDLPSLQTSTTLFKHCLLTRLPY